MVCAHRPGMERWNVDEMSAIGVRFGKGLQLTNIVKDIARDLQNGRCYVPESLLSEAGLTAADLLVEANLPRFRPVLGKLIAWRWNTWTKAGPIPWRSPFLKSANAWLASGR